MGSPSFQHTNTSCIRNEKCRIVGPQLLKWQLNSISKFDKFQSNELNHRIRSGWEKEIGPAIAIELRCPRPIEKKRASTSVGFYVKRTQLTLPFLRLVKKHPSVLTRSTIWDNSPAESSCFTPVLGGLRLLPYWFFDECHIVHPEVRLKANTSGRHLIPLT